MKALLDLGSIWRWRRGFNTCMMSDGIQDSTESKRHQSDLHPSWDINTCVSQPST